jgi:uncharacterized protein YndB with AHSA1/START domain
MTDTATRAQTLEIVVEEVFPHSVEAIWKALTDGGLMGRWLMEPTGFEPVPGNRFTYQTTPAGEWDGKIQCEVIAVSPCELLSYSWAGGHIKNDGYGSLLDTVVTFELKKVHGGTRLRMTHSGFDMVRNKTAHAKMSAGWPGVVRTIGVLAGEAS